MRSRALLLVPLLALPPAGLAGAAPAAAPVKTEAKAQSAPQSVQWVALDEAVKKASSSGKYVFVTVYTDWCAYCRKLSATTLRDGKVLEELGKNFQSVRVNAESPRPVTWKGKKLSERAVAADAWGVTTYPTLLFLNGKGEIIGSYSAYADPKLMMSLLTYISSGAREKNVSFDDFLEGKG